MSETATTRNDDPTANGSSLFVAFELGEREWKLVWVPSLDSRPRGATIRARETARLLEILEQAGQCAGAARIASCYEAGRDGFWIHRFLRAHGIDNRIVDSASIEVNRRARRRTTDRLDAQKLLTMLLREALGEDKVWSVVRVPSVEDEDARSLQRELSVPKTRFSWDHGHLSRPVPSRGMPRPGGGLRVAVSADAVEQRQRHG